MKKYLKKSLSVFLAFMMVCSCFVFAPEMFTLKADAASAGSYTVRFYYDVDDAPNGCTTTFQIWYRPNNGTATETSQTFTMSIGSTGDNQSSSYTVPGFPTKFKFRINVSGMTLQDVTARRIDIQGTQVWSGSKRVNPGWWGDSDTGEWAHNGAYPTPSKVEWTPNPVNLTVPGGLADTAAYDSTATFDNAPTGYDQYGVTWYQAPSYYVNDTDDTPTTGIGTNTTLHGGITTATITSGADLDKGKITVSSNATLKDFVADSDNMYSREVYVRAAYSKSVYSDKSAKVTIYNPKYQWEFRPNGGTFVGDYAENENAYWTYYYHYPISELDFPQNATKEGYIYEGQFWTTAANAKKLEIGNREISSNTYWIAHWSPIVNKIAFYDYNGQPVKQVDAHYDDVIQSHVPTNFTEGVTSYTDSKTGNTYTFSRWVNWETGEEINKAAKLQSLDENAVLKFIAEYTIDKDSIPTYTYNFYNNGSQLSAGSGYYRNRVTFPADPSTPDESGEDGREFTFAGWVAKNANDADTSDIIAAIGQSAEEAAGDNTFLPKTEDAFFYYLKEDTVFVPVYTTQYKQNEVRLHYKDASGQWQVGTIEKSDATRCFEWLNISVPNPIAYNGRNAENTPKTYQFIGWTRTVEGNTPDNDQNGDLTYKGSNSINVLLHNDFDLWAVYEEQDINYTAYYYNNGEIFHQDNIDYGKEYSVGYAVNEDGTKGEKLAPTKDREGMIGYEFIGWFLDPDCNTPAEDTYSVDEVTLNNPTFYAGYKEIQYYEVKFLDNDGSVIESGDSYVEGDKVTPPAVQDKVINAEIADIFIGWNDSKDHFYPKEDVDTFTVGKNDETYTAVYDESTRRYTVTFYDVNGSVLDEKGEETGVLWRGELEYGENIAKFIKENGLEDLVKGVPENTKQYTYEFSGWSPVVNDYTTVTGNAEYRATYTTRSVTYKVHWLVPTSAAQNEFTELSVSNYLYERIISVPSTLPTCDEPAVWEDGYSKDEYNWGFLGWYKCDAQGNIETDENGEVPFVRGTQATEDHTYYVAKFGYIAKAFTISIYNTSGNLLAQMAGQRAGETVYLPLSFTQPVTGKYHYIIENFTSQKTGDVVATVTDETTEDGTVNQIAAYLVGSADGNNLVVNFREEEHTYGDWKTVTEPNYARDGLEEQFCNVCGYRVTNSIDKLTDDQTPLGVIAIGGYTWNDGDAKEGIAYVRNDAFVSIIVRDRGNEKVHGNTTAGVGIKSIVYSWVDAEGNKKTSTPKEFDPYTVDANWNFQLPEDFEGKYIEAVITDYDGHEYKIVSQVLNVDMDKPEILTGGDCENIYFVVLEEYEVGSVKVEKTVDGVLTALVYGEDFVDAGESDMQEGMLGYFIPNASGEYLITVTDKAGNIATATASASGKHVFDKEVVFSEPTCTQTGINNIVCSVCGVTEKDGEEDKEIVTDKLGHVPEEEWEVLITKEPECKAEGSKDYICTRCKEVVKTEVIAELDHKMVLVKEESKPATCTEDGVNVYRCERYDVCGEEETEAVTQTGHTLKEHVEEPANCTKGATEYDLCAVCGEKYNIVSEDEGLGHIWVDHAADADCKGVHSINGVNQQYHLWICERCGEVNETFPEYRTHKIQETVIDETCTEDRVHVYECEYCDYSYEVTERLTKLGHNWQPDTKAATCDEPGYTQEKCSRCQATQNRKDIDPLGHEFTVLDEEASNFATCVTDGTEVYKCVRYDDCGKTETKEVSATGEHKYTVELTDKYVAPTCFIEGSRTYQCETCHEAEEVRPEARLEHAHADGDEGRVLVKANCITEGIEEYTCIHTDEDGNTHTYEVNTGKNSSVHNENSPLTATHIDPTCEDAGEGTYTCPDCGRGFVKEIAPLDHNYVEKREEPTCDKAGRKWLECSRCEDIKENSEESIPATGEHKLTRHERVEPTCVEDGLDAYYECSVCKKLFKDDAGKTETDLEDLKLTATGSHSYETIVVDATCTKEGYTYDKCSVCGDETEHRNITEALGHVKGALVKVNKAATCQDDGLGVYKCTRCGETFEQKIDKDPQAHSAVWTTKTKATCEKDGTREKVCDICGKVLDSTTIPALGHNWVVTRENKLSDDGKQIITVVTKTCLRCGEIETSKEGATDLFVVTFVISDGEDGTRTKMFEKGGYLRDSDFPEVSADVTTAGKKAAVTWYIDGVEVVLPMKVTSDLTITAKVEYIDIEYTVNFADSLSGRVISTAKYTYNAAVKAPADSEVPIHQGYLFVGWSTEPGTSETYTGEAIPNVTDDVTYYTVFERTGTSDKTYYVNFKNDTGTKTIVSVTVTEGSKVARPEDPAKSRNSTFHYDFIQWIDENGSAFDFDTEITSNVVLYAQFSAVKHSDRAAGIDAKEATCTSWAEVTYQCRDCGYVWSQYIIDENNPPQHDVYIVSDVTDGNVRTITYACHKCNVEPWTKTIVTGTSAQGIVVTVRDSSGNAVAGARVQLYLGNLETMTATTNENGQAIFPKYDAETAPKGLKDGSYTVKVTKSGYQDASGTLVIKNGVGSVRLNFAKVDCHCVCHSSGFFGTIKRFFNKFFRLFNKNYVCCNCGQSEVIY